MDKGQNTLWPARLFALSCRSSISRLGPQRLLGKRYGAREELPKEVVVTVGFGHPLPVGPQWPEPLEAAINAN